MSRRKNRFPFSKAVLWDGPLPHKSTDAALFTEGDTVRVMTIPTEKSQRLGAFLVHLFNTYIERDLLIEEMAFVLNGCLETRGSPDFATEFDAEILLSKAKKRPRFHASHRPSRKERPPTFPRTSSRTTD